jgi:hypothetical protein
VGPTRRDSPLRSICTEKRLAEKACRCVAASRDAAQHLLEPRPVFTIAVYFWCSIAALAFFATLFALAADYVSHFLPKTRTATRRDELDEAPRSTIVPISVAR